MVKLGNMFHQLWNSEFALFDLENYFFNCYFASIIYYAGSKLIKQIYIGKEEDLPLKILRATYCVLMLIHLGLFIASVSAIS